MIHKVIHRNGQIPMKISGIVIEILPIPMHHFMYHSPCFLCDFMKLIPQETPNFSCVGL